MTLKEFIVENRLQIDAARPDKVLIWEGIRQRVERRRHLRLVVVSAAAAAAVVSVIFLSAVLLLRPAVLSPGFQGNGEFVRQRDGFVVEVTRLELKLNESGVPRSAWPDLQELRYTDDLIALYTKNLNQTGPHAELLNTLLDLHTKKILILERMLNEMQNSSHYEMAHTTL